MIPLNASPTLTAVMERCWAADARVRPGFEHVLMLLQEGPGPAAHEHGALAQAQEGDPVAQEYTSSASNN